MSKKDHRPEGRFAKQREADVLVSQGKKVVDVIKSLGIADVTYCFWRQEYGWISVPQPKRPNVNSSISLGSLLGTQPLYYKLYAQLAGEDIS